MHLATVTLNRQMIRLSKGVLKAWEQWVDETENEECQGGFQSISPTNTEQYRGDTHTIDKN